MPAESDCPQRKSTWHYIRRSYFALSINYEFKKQQALRKEPFSKKDLIGMLAYTGLFLLVIAVSLDGLGVGVAYGIRKIRVPFMAIIIIILCSLGIVLLSMTIGNALGNILSEKFANLIGGIILISIGGFCFFNVLRSKNEDDYVAESLKENEGNRMAHFKTVLKEPQQADLDASGIISAKEALLLGIALALDAFGAGIGAAIIGYSPLVTALSIALMSGVFLYSGIQIGIFLSKYRWLKQMTFLPPVLLVALGILNIIGA